MAIAGASINVESLAATSEQQPKLVLADLPDAIPPADGLPILARLPDYGMRPPSRNAKSASLESAVRRWFGQRAALAILLGSGILMAATAIAPFVGRSPKPEPAAPQPAWQPITDQSTHHAPDVPRFETNAAFPMPAATGPAAIPQAADDRTSAQLKQQPFPGMPAANLPAFSGAPLGASSPLTRLPPIDKPQASTELPEVRRPITVEQLFAASAARSVPSFPLARDNYGSASATAGAAGPVANPKTAPPIDSQFAQDNAPASRDVSQGRPNTPLVDRRLSPPSYQPDRPFDEQMVSTGETAGPGTAQLEGVIETPSLRANYDPTHSQRY